MYVLNLPNFYYNRISSYRKKHSFLYVEKYLKKKEAFDVLKFDLCRVH